MLIPQINGGDAGIAIKAGLMSLVTSALTFVHTHGNTLTYATMSVGKAILVCYSQSGGNVFTAAYRNAADVRGLICFEPQYMNKHLKGEDKSFVLGKDAIPVILRQGGKVAIIGRHKNGWEAKYLPERVDPATLIVLPDDAHYFLLDYPAAVKSYDSAKSPVLALRYSRLLQGKNDRVIQSLLGGELGDVDTDSALTEAKVEDIIKARRAAGFNDEKLVKSVLTAEYNVDESGGYYTHNFIIAAGQETTPDNKAIRGFFGEALARM